MTTPGICCLCCGAVILLAVAGVRAVAFTPKVEAGLHVSQPPSSRTAAAAPMRWNVGAVRDGQQGVRRQTAGARVGIGIFIGIGAALALARLGNRIAGKAKRLA